MIWCSTRAKALCNSSKTLCDLTTAAKESTVGAPTQQQRSSRAELDHHLVVYVEGRASKNYTVGGVVMHVDDFYLSGKKGSVLPADIHAPDENMSIPMRWISNIAVPEPQEPNATVGVTSSQKPMPTICDAAVC